MASAALLDELQATLDAIDTLTAQQLLELWDSIDLLNPSALGPLTEGVFDITTVYGDITATLSADWYDTVRAEAAPVGRFTAIPADPVPFEQVRGATRWATTTLRDAEPDLDTALTKLNGSVRRLVRHPGRHTILTATESDPARPRYARVTRGGCPFCLMLASRGAVYSREQPFKAHDNCRCAAVPVWTPDDVPASTKRVAAEWDEVTAGHSGKDAVAVWRRHVEETQVAPGDSFT